MPHHPLTDSHGRRVDYLRLSVIDRCNLRCAYCMPAKGMVFAPRRELLTDDDILFVLQEAAALGFTRLRITGGEPLLRPGLPQLVTRVTAETPFTAPALTTNGLLLAEQAEVLAAAGLSRVNVSIDSLRPDRYAVITRNGLIDKVWRGIEAATAAGLGPIHINTVLLEGFNEDEVEGWLELARDNPFTVRFLELMPVGEGAELTRHGRFANLSAMRDRIVATHTLVPCPSDGFGPARTWQQPGARGSVGFITPLSHGYCDTCTRFRLTAVGELRACLADDRQVSVREAILGRDRAALRDGFFEAARTKIAGHAWNVDAVTRTGMSELGG